MSSPALQLAASDVDAIVREVVARLLALGGTKPAAKQPTVAAETKTETLAADALSLASAVISVGEITGKLDGKRRLIIGKRAVVTPAARDMLRAAKVTVERQESAKPSAAKKPARRLVIGVADCRFDAASLVGSVRKSGNTVEQLAKAGLPSAISELSTEVVRGGALGLLITDRTAAAVCGANRHAGVRATTATNVQELQNAISDVGVNVLIVSPRGVSGFQLERMVTTLLAGGGGPVASDLKTLLGAGA